MTGSQQSTEWNAHVGSSSTPGPVGLVGLIAGVGLGTAVAGLVVGLLAASVAVSTGNVKAGILVRGLLSLFAVLLIGRAAGRRAKQGRTARPVLVVGAVSLLGFLLDPMTWVARTTLAQLAFEPGARTLIGDLALWLLAAGLGALWGTRAAAGPSVATTPYG